MGTLSIIGAVASILGAAFAAYQAYKARAYRDEILEDRLRMQLFDVLESARLARKECEKIVTRVGNPPRGIKTQDVVDTIRNCLNRIGDDAHRFTVPKLSNAIRNAQDYLSRYVTEQKHEKRPALGDKLYAALDEVVSCVRQEVDGAV